MSLWANAADGLIGSGISGSIALFIFGRRRRSAASSMGDAWQVTAGELQQRLEDRYQGEIRYLRHELAKCQESKSRG